VHIQILVLLALHDIGGSVVCGPLCMLVAALPFIAGQTALFQWPNYNAITVVHWFAHRYMKDFPANL
jgi:hypothetical protein